MKGEKGVGRKEKGIGQTGLRGEKVKALEERLQWHVL